MSERLSGRRLALAREQESKFGTQLLTDGVRFRLWAPQSDAASKLVWEDRDIGVHARFLSLYRTLLALRRQHIVPRLKGIAGHSRRFRMIGARGIEVTWTLGDGSTYSLIANLSPEPLDGMEVSSGDHLWLEGFATGNVLEAWSVVFQLKPGK